MKESAKKEELKITSWNPKDKQRLVMPRPKVDDELTLLTDFGETKAMCAEVSDNPLHAGGTLLKVMARGPFEEGQLCWIVEPDGSKIGATVQSVAKQTVDSEVLLAVMFA